MKIGVPKEIKDQEHRVGLTPAGVYALRRCGHEVQIEKGAGLGSGFLDSDYEAVGGVVVDYSEQIYLNEMVVKVKEPQLDEYDMLRSGQLLFTYLHLAAEPQLTRSLLEREVIGIAYETITDSQGRLPLLAPMSEVAGRLSVQVGANCLMKYAGGNGTLLAGVPGVPPATVVVIGGGVVGTQAARMAMGLGADVVILDVNLDRLRTLDELYGPQLRTRYSDALALNELLPQADLVIGAVLEPGKQAAKLIDKQQVKSMKAGAVIVDVAIDQGGCSEYSRPTTHSDPTFVVDNIVHYCVANMPGATPYTSTRALTNATLPYVMMLANKGYKKAFLENTGFAAGLNVYRGNVTYRAVAEDLGYEYVSFSQLPEFAADTEDMQLVV